MKLKVKNDKERIEFLEERREQDGWYLWKEDDDLNRKWWRFDLPDCALVVEERLQTIHWPDDHQKWIESRWYIIKDWHLPFEDGAGSRTMALAELKRCQKEELI